MLRVTRIRARHVADWGLGWHLSVGYGTRSIGIRVHEWGVRLMFFRWHVCIHR